MSQMFRPIAPAAPLVTLSLDGDAIALPQGEMLAAALLTAGVAHFGASILRGEPRGPLCLMGSCFQCVVEIDDQLQVRACRVAVAAGMRIRRSLAASPVRPPDGTL